MIIFGTRGVTSTLEKGDFLCPACCSHREYAHKRVRRFFTDELMRRPYDVGKQVRALEEKYRQTDRDALAERLRKTLPEVWTDR